MFGDLLAYVAMAVSEQGEEIVSQKKIRIDLMGPGGWQMPYQSNPDLHTEEGARSRNFRARRHQLSQTISTPLQQRWNKSS
jgi:hypothetical protein